MIIAKDIVLAINENNYSVMELVTILELTINNLDINTISEMARKENKSPNGIRKSNNYRKLKIGKQIFAIKGIKDNNLPF